MKIQFRPICEVLTTLAESARTIADDYFAFHATAIDWVGAGPTDRAVTRRVLVARTEVGRSQQRQLSTLLDHLDRLSSSTPLAVPLRECIRSCRATFQDGTPFRDSLDSHRAEFRELTGDMIRLADAMPDPTPGEVLLVADTATLLEFSAFERWTYPQFGSFTLVLPTATLGELNELQTFAQDVVVREQCALIRAKLQKIRDQSDGTEVTRGIGAKARVVVRLLELAFDETVDWLDPRSSEDQLVGRVIQLNREHPRCVVALVTQNARLLARADEARLDTLPPPGSWVPTPARAAEWP